MKFCNYDLLFLIIIFFIIIFVYDQVKTFVCKKENFQTTITGYQADVEAIRNLSSIATSLTTSNQLTMPGTLNVTNTLTVSGNIKSTYGVIEGRALYASGGTQNNPNNWGTHFPYIGNGNNYIRGDTNINGNINQDFSYQTTSGNITASNGNINAPKGTITGKDLVATNNLTVSGNINASNGIITGKDIITTNNLTINGFDLKRLRSMFTCAGYAVDSDGSSILLFEGTNTLLDLEQNRWNYAYIFRGWRVTFTGRNSLNITETNTTSNIPIKSALLYDNPQSYVATWIGW